MNVVFTDFREFPGLYDIDRPVLLLDFDGTVSLGNGPALAYGREVDAEIEQPGFMRDLRQALNGAVPPGLSTSPRDGYDAVRLLAEAYGASAQQLSAAYTRSRANLAALDISTPKGLPDFLDSVDAYVILATNAPAIGLPEALEKLGVTGAFDAVFTSVGKPQGLADLVRELNQTRVLSVGDIWDFDLAPVAAAGKDTALVGASAFDATPVEPTMRAHTLDQLYADIRSWLAMTSVPHTERKP